MTTIPLASRRRSGERGGRPARPRDRVTRRVEAEVPAPAEQPTPAVPGAPVAPIDPTPQTPAAPEEPATVPAPVEPPSPVAPTGPEIEPPQAVGAGVAAPRFAELLEGAIVPSRRPAAASRRPRLRLAGARRAPSNTR